MKWPLPKLFLPVQLTSPGSIATSCVSCHPLSSSEPSFNLGDLMSPTTNTMQHQPSSSKPLQHFRFDQLQYFCPGERKEDCLFCSRTFYVSCAILQQWTSCLSLLHHTQLLPLKSSVLLTWRLLSVFQHCFCCLLFCFILPFLLLLLSY